VSFVRKKLEIGDLVIFLQNCEALLSLLTEIPYKGKEIFCSHILGYSRFMADSVDANLKSATNGGTGNINVDAGPSCKFLCWTYRCMVRDPKGYVHL
jgi:hypothetical protein